MNASFAGVTGLNGTANEILFRYTFLGDTDLDLDVDGNDFLGFLTGVANGGSGWAFGDTDYDLDVDGNDFLGFLTGLTAFQTGGPLLMSAVEVDSLYRRVEAGELSFDEIAAAVPEPSFLPVFVAIGAGLMTRRARHRAS